MPTLKRATESAAALTAGSLRRRSSGRGACCPTHQNCSVRLNLSDSTVRPPWRHRVPVQHAFQPAASEGDSVPTGIPLELVQGELEHTEIMKKKGPKMEAREPVFPEVCTQPQCMLRDESFDSEFAADLIVRLLSGEDVSEAVPAERRIDPFDLCRRCVLSVARGGRPIVTAEELKELIVAGRRSHRRRRRSRRRA